MYLDSTFQFLFLLNLSLDDALKANFRFGVLLSAIFLFKIRVILLILNLASMIDRDACSLEDRILQVVLANCLFILCVNLFFNAAHRRLSQWMVPIFFFSLRLVLKYLDCWLRCKLQLVVFFAQYNQTFVHAIEETKILSYDSAHFPA